MSEHRATLSWERGNADFTYKTYPRAHRWDFGDGHVVEASAAPDFLGDPSRVDPEQAFVASLSSCHALTFLAICAMQKISVDRYVDKAVGFLEKAEDGKPWLARVELHPEITFSEGVEVGAERLAGIHHSAHTECFLARSVKTEVVVAD